MRIDRERKNVESLPCRGIGRFIASAGRLAVLGVALSAWVVTAGCIGLAGSPAGGSNSGGGTGNSGASSSASQISPSAAQLNFGNVTVGSSTSQLVTLTAVGNTNVTISSVTASGTGFSASGGTNVTLVPNQSVTLSVAFQPTATGNATGQLVVSSNATNSSVQIGLSGAGVAASQHSVALNWQPSSSPVAGYFVFRGPSVGNLAPLNTSPVTATGYTDRNVANGQTYVYAVKSVDSNNVMSNYSNPVTVQIPSQ